MSSSHHSGTPNILAIGVTPEEKRQWFPTARGLTVCTTGGELPGRVNAGIGGVDYLLLGGELSESQVRTLRRKAQERNIRFYGPTDGTDLGRMAHRLVGLTPPPCRTDDEAKEQCQELALEAWGEADKLKLELETAQARGVELEGNLRHLRAELATKVEMTARTEKELVQARSQGADAAARAEELHGQLAAARRSEKALREEKERTEKELGRAREDLAGMRARLEQAASQIATIRAEAAGQIASAKDRSTHDWKEALSALAREPGLKDGLEKQGNELADLRRQLVAAASREKNEAKVRLQLEEEVELGRAAQEQLVALRVALSLPSFPSRRKKGKK